MKIRLSVIIVSFKNIQILRNCLNSIKKYNDIGDELEVIISDNSPDTTLYDTIKSEYEWIKIIKNENIGFGAGNNKGFEISSGEYLLFLNPDTILVEPVFKFAIEKFEKNEKLALFGVQLRSAEMKKNTSFLMIDKYSVSATLIMKFYRALNIYKDGKMFICGADLFVRREAFEQAGKFDEKIFMYKEEADLTKRIKLHSAAKKTAFYKKKSIIHLEGGTEEGNIQSTSQLERMWDTDLYYAEKWNKDIKKIYKQRKRYQKFKLFIYKLTFKKHKVQNTNRIIEFYNTMLKSL